MRIGFKEGREGSRIFYTHTVKAGKDVHAVDRYLEIVKFLGCDISDIKFPFPLSFNSPEVIYRLLQTDNPPSPPLIKGGRGIL